MSGKKSTKSKVVKSSSSSNEGFLKGDLVSQKRRFTFTHYDLSYVPELYSFGDKHRMTYLMCQHEVAPTTNREHIQGYFEVNEKKSGLSIQKSIQNQGKVPFNFLTASRGTQKQNQDYVSKDHSSVPGSLVELGTAMDDEEQVDIWMDIKDKIVNGEYRTFKDLVSANPMLIMRYSQGIRILWDELRPQFKYNLYSEYLTLYPWQETVLSLLDESIDPRAIVWIYSKQGRMGKSDMCSHLVSEHGFLCLKNGKSADIAHAWNGEDVVFDFSKSQESHINYSILEDIKNGTVFDPKFHSQSKRYERPHVFVFANFLPEISQMMIDRWSHVAEINSNFELEWVDVPNLKSI